MDHLREMDPALRIANLKNWLPIQRVQDLSIFAMAREKQVFPNDVNEARLRSSRRLAAVPLAALFRSKICCLMIRVVRKEKPSRS